VDVEGATKSVFRILRENDISSVSFPALATGVAGFPLDHCSKIILGISIDEARKEKAPGEIRFILWGRENLEIFERILKNYLGEER